MSPTLRPWPTEKDFGRRNRGEGFRELRAFIRVEPRKHPEVSRRGREEAQQKPSKYTQREAACLAKEFDHLEKAKATQN